MVTENFNNFNNRFNRYQDDYFLDSNFSNSLSNKRFKGYNILKELVSDKKYYALENLIIEMSNKHAPEEKLADINSSIEILVFYNCCFNFPFKYERLIYLKSVIFIRCTFQKITFSNPSYHLHFVNCNFEDDFLIDADNSVAGKEFTFSRVNFSGNFKIINADKLHLLKFSERGNRIFQDFSLLNSSVVNIELLNLEIKGISIIEVTNNSMPVDPIGKISIKECLLNSFNICNLKLEQAVFEDIKFINFSLEKVEVDEIKICGIFQGELALFKKNDINYLGFINSDSNHNHSFQIIDATKIGNLTFLNTTNFGELLCSSGCQVSNVTMTGDTGYDGKFKSIYLSGEFNEVRIEGLLISENLGIGGITTLKSLTLNNNKIGQFTFSESSKNFINFYILHNLFQLEANVSAVKIANFEIEENYFESNLNIKICESRSKLLFKNCYFLKKLLFERCDLNDLEISGGILGELAIDRTSEIGSKRTIFNEVIISKFKPLDKAGVSHYFSNSTVNQAFLNNNSLSKETTISFNDSYINSFVVRHYNIYGNLYFRKCSVNKSYVNGNLPQS